MAPVLPCLNTTPGLLRWCLYCCACYHTGTIPACRSPATLAAHALPLLPRAAIYRPVTAVLLCKCRCTCRLPLPSRNSNNVPLPSRHCCRGANTSHTFSTYLSHAGFRGPLPYLYHITRCAALHTYTYLPRVCRTCGVPQRLLSTYRYKYIHSGLPVLRTLARRSFSAVYCCATALHLAHARTAT